MQDIQASNVLVGSFIRLIRDEYQLPDMRLSYEVILRPGNVG
jgi:hypothetical protein